MSITTITIICVAIAIVAVVIIIAVAMHKRKKKRLQAERERERARRVQARQRRQEREAARRMEAEEFTEEDFPEEKPPTLEEIEELLDDPIHIKGKDEEAGYVSQVKHESLDVRWPCGFDFSDVVVGYRSKLKTDDGVDDAQTVYASGFNYEKIMQDISRMEPLFKNLYGTSSFHLYKVAFPNIMALVSQIRPFGTKSSKVKGVDNTAAITIHGSLEDGRSRQYPVTVRATLTNMGVDVTRRSSSTLAASEAVRNIPSTDGSVEAIANAFGSGKIPHGSPDSLVLDMYYEADGVPTRGKVVAWQGKRGYQCDFAWGRVTQEYLPTAMKVKDSPGSWTTVFGDAQDRQAQDKQAENKQ